jgi:hypothetical protein
MKNIQVEINGTIKEGVIIEDAHFLGGSKFVNKEKNGYSGFTSINLVKIIEEKKT